MNCEIRRNKVFECMETDSALILFSGIEIHISADTYMPFEANRNFFYLTGIRRDHMILVMEKYQDRNITTLYIEEADPAVERWTGHKLTIEEAREISGIETVRYIDSFEAALGTLFCRKHVDTMYFDLYRHQYEDLPDYNVVKARDISERFMGVRVLDCSEIIAKLRMVKDEDEIIETQNAVAITKQALENVMKNLKPGMKEYQVQADFEYCVKYCGGEGTAFATIAGSGINGTMLHYETNQGTCEDGSLILLDLGARYNGYNADVTRTYPVNGHFTERQKYVYEIVLKANKAIIDNAKAGVTLLELNNICKKVLAEGMIGLGLIKDESEIGKYYMHGVSHHLGIDVHDVTAKGCDKLQAGAIITDEPGLYIDEWAIGIRIEDDLLITDDGCIVLTKDIIKEPEEIEEFMAAERL